MFGIVTFVSFILFVITAPDMTKEKTNSTKTEKQQLAKNQPAEMTAPNITQDKTEKKSRLIDETISSQVTKGNSPEKPLESSDETAPLTKVIKGTTDQIKDDNQSWEIRGAGFFSDGYEFKDGVARVTVSFSAHDSLGSATYRILEELYKMAKDKSVNRIEVSCIMNASGFSDRYGNTPKGDFVKNGNPMWSMGDFSVNQQRIDEIRKYKTVQKFEYDKINKLWIELLIKELKHSQYIEK